MSTIIDDRTEPAVEEFINALRRQMEETGITPSELARRAKVSRPYLHRVLTGKQTPRLDWASKVSREIGLKIMTVKG